MPSAVSNLCDLRDTVARIERAGEGRERRVSAHDRIVPLGDGTLALDAALGGGLRRGTLHEIMAASARDGAAAAGFAVALASRCAQAGAVIWIVDDRAAWETGTPYRPGMAAQGLDPDKLLLVKTRDAHTTLWATEEALRAGARVVLTELWRARSYDLAVSRRLLLAARRRSATSLLVHVGLDEGAVSSAADTRFAVAARPGEHRSSAAGRTPVPGSAGFGVRITKLRGSASEGLCSFDRDEVHALVWNRKTQFFCKAQNLDTSRSIRNAAPLHGRSALANGAA